MDASANIQLSPDNWHSYVIELLFSALAEARVFAIFARCLLQVLGLPLWGKPGE